MYILYGGSFNPPTLAHEAIIKKINEIYNPKKIVIMPVGSTYTRKDNRYNLDRIRMLKLVTSKYDNVEISDYEINNPFKGTIETLKYLETLYQNKFSFVMGADNLLEIKTWIGYEELLKNHLIICFNRNNILDKNTVKNIAESYQAKIDLIPLNINISSSEIRKDFKLNKDNLSKEVYDYIITNQLYEEEGD